MFVMAFVGVVICCYVLIMMGTALVSLGSIASASPQNDRDCIVLAKNLPFGCDTTLDTTLFEGIDGEPASYEWYGPFPPASGPSPDTVIPEGTHTLSLITFDGSLRSPPLPCIIRVEPAITFSLHAKRGKVVIDLPDKENLQQIEIYRAPANNPTGMKKIVRLYPGTSTYTDSTVKEETYLYIVAALSGGQWLFSEIRAIHPYSLLPRWNYSPVICSLPVVTAYVGLPYSYDVLAVDPQDDTLIYSLDNPHEGMHIDKETGVIEWLPDTAGDYDTTVQITDRKGYVTSQTFIIEVEELSNPNRMPVADAGGPYKVELGQPIALNGSGSYDPDGASLSCQWSLGDGQHATGVLPTHTYESPGTYQVVLTVTDGRGGLASTSTTVTVQECPAPRVSLSISPAAVPPGEPCMLVWTSENAEALGIDHGIGSVGASGSLMIYPEETTTISITATGRCGTSTQTATALVYEPPVLNCSVAADTIRPGDSTVITWTSASADNVSIDQGIGTVMPDGMLSISPEATSTYTLTAKGPGGIIAKSVTIKVLPGTNVTIDASPKSITPGQASVLKWASSETQNVTIDQGIGQVSLSGTMEVHPQETTTYTITATGPGSTVTDDVTIDVHPPPEVHISADPSVVDKGQITILTWTSEHAYAASVDNGIGDVAIHGSLVLNPSDTTTYTISVQGEGGCANASVTIEVMEKPEVVVAVYPNTIHAGEQSTLTWTSRDAVGVIIDNDIGPAPVNGFIEVCPTTTTTYTITSVGSRGGTATGQATVTVLPPPSEPSPDLPANTPGIAPP